MYFATVLAPLVWATNAAAGVISNRQDPHMSDFRSFGQPGCYADNQGIYTLTQSQTNQCYSFNGPAVGSIMLVNANAGCTLYVYPEERCPESGKVEAAKPCTDGAFKSYKLSCV